MKANGAEGPNLSQQFINDINNDSREKSQLRGVIASQVKCKRFSLGVAAMVAAYWIGAMSLAEASILVNGGFESPAIAPNSVSSAAPNGWTFFNAPDPGQQATINNSSGTAIWETWLSGATGYVPVPLEGQQFVSIGDYPQRGIFQSFTITTAGSYSFTWYDSSYYSGGVLCSPYIAEIQDSSSTLVSSVTLTPSDVDVWHYQSMFADLSPGGYTLSFIPQGYQGLTQPLIDNVAVTAVPEPSTLGVLGLGGLGLLMRRRQAQTGSIRVS